MTIKLLRRQTYLRERDYNRKFRRAAEKCGYQFTQWDSLTYDMISKDVMVRTLRGCALQPTPYRYIEQFDSGNEFEKGRVVLFYLEFLCRTEKFYNPRWDIWHWRFHNDQVQLRYRTSYDWEDLGIVVMEREYDTLNHSAKIVSW